MRSVVMGGELGNEIFCGVHCDERENFYDKIIWRSVMLGDAIGGRKAFCAVLTFILCP